MADIAIRTSTLTDQSDLENVRILFDRNGYPRTGDEVRWIYERTGEATPVAALAESGDETAGLYVVVPARFQVADRLVVAYQSLDTMVDERFRGAGLFTKTARTVYESLVREHRPFVYGFPNGNSFHGFIAKLEWISLDPVPFLFRPVGFGFAAGKLHRSLRWIPGRVPSRRSSGGDSQLVDVLPRAAEVDDLWADFSASLRVARVRDHAFLSKRYSRHPRTRYSYRTIRAGGRLEGLIIYCAQDKHGGRVGYVMELMFRRGPDDAAKKLLSDAVSDMIADRCDGILAWCFDHSPAYRAFRHHWFLPLPPAVRPVALHLGVRVLDASLLTELRERKNWYISYSDSDTV